jgi:hypothetical protein
MIVKDLIDEWTGLSNDRLPWEKYWRSIASYVLPQTEGFDRLLSNNADAAVASVVGTPVSAEKSKDLYDMTSLWGIERLTAGLLSLKTPETDTWHTLGLGSLFGEEPSYGEKTSLERLANYLFAVRSNPKSNFWGAHRAALKSMCAFGDGFMFVEQIDGAGARQPYRYEYAPIIECYPSVGPDGRLNRMFRVFRWSALQVATKWQNMPNATLPARLIEMANDPQKKHHTVRVLHAVKVRDDERRNRLGVRGAAFQSHFCLPDDTHHIGEGGFYEFPFHRYAWADTGARPFSEGPIAYAMGEVKSLQEMAKNELIAIQSAIRPAYATAGKNFTRLNLNPGVVNPGLISPDGKQLFAAMNSGVRPDFAQAVMEARRNSVREMLYLNLWQAILQNVDETATQALLRAQEKGELLGPVGISLNGGLSMMVDREIGVLSRKGAFDEGSPLEMPDSLVGRQITPTFNSPMDRLRRVNKVVGMTRLIEFATPLEQMVPGSVSSRLDVDEMLEAAQDILGAPTKVLRRRELAQADRDTNAGAAQAAAAMETMQRGGEAARAIGEGGAALKAGVDAVAGSGRLQKLLDSAPLIANAAQRGANAGARQ